MLGSIRFPTAAGINIPHFSVRLLSNQSSKVTLHVSLGSPPLKAVICFVTSCILIFNIVQIQTVTVIVTQTKKPHQLLYLTKVVYFNLKQNLTVQVHFKESSLLHTLLPLSRLCGNGSKTTKLFTRHGEQPGCIKSAWLHWRLFSLFIYFNSSVTEQPAVMIEQKSKNRSTVLKNISAGWDNGTNKGSSCH